MPGAVAINQKAHTRGLEPGKVLAEDAEAWQILHITPGSKKGEIDKSTSDCNSQVYLPTPLASYFLMGAKRRQLNSNDVHYTDAQINVNWGDIQNKHKEKLRPN